MKIPTYSNDSEEYKKGKAALRKIGLLILNFAVIYGLFRVILALSVKYNAAWIYYVLTIVYGAAIVALFLAFFVLNGYKFSSGERTRDELPARWTDEKKDKFLAGQKKNGEKARNLILFIFPLVLTMIISYIELMFFG